MIDYKSELNDKQYEAVTAKDNRLLFLAGAGVGKTRTIVYRAAYLVENGVDPRNILMLTFTNKAADEMVNRLNTMVLGRAHGILACTFHSFCANQLRIYGDVIGFDTNFTILSAPDAEEVIRMQMVEQGYSNSDGFPKISAVAAMESMALNKNMSLVEVCQEEERFHSLLPWINDIEIVLRESEMYRYANNLMTYDDLMFKFVNLLKASSAVRQSIRDNYKYIMVDEYQDTNVIQDEILELIKPYNLAVVGDDCQSLYGFRGAEVTNIINFPVKHMCRTIKLERNYRSNQAILDLSNEMMRLHCTEGIPKWLTASHSQGSKPVLFEVKDLNAEAKFVYTLMKHWKAKGNKPSECCVLVRSSRASAYLEAELMEKGVAFDKRGGRKFFELSHVQDVLSLFNVLKDRTNEIAWFRSLAILRNIGDVNAKKLAKRCVEEGPAVLLSKDVASRRFGSDARWFYDILFGTQSNGKSWHEIFNNLCDFYLKVTEVNIKKSRKSQKSKDSSLIDLEEKIKPDIKILKKVADGYTSSNDFLDSLLLDNVSSLEETDDEKFIISTIHSVKGLEFETVILMNVAEGLFPRSDIYDQKKDNEELRCYYVALTRAKYYLYMTHPKTYMQNGRFSFADLPHYFRGLRDYYDYRIVVKD